MDTQRTQARENSIGHAIVGAALKVHTRLGPGLLESVYVICLAHEMKAVGISVRREVGIHIDYAGIAIQNAYRIDLLVDDCVVVEAKALETLLPVHRAQLLSYLKLGKYKLGLLLNFNTTHMRDGIVRIVNGL